MNVCIFKILIEPPRHQGTKDWDAEHNGNFAFASKNGVDRDKVREALLGGFAYSRILENHGQRMIDRNFKPGFKSWMHEKDLNIVMQTAHELGLCLPGSAATAQMFNAMVGSGLGEEDSIAVLKLLERLSGQE